MASSCAIAQFGSVIKSSEKMAGHAPLGLRKNNNDMSRLHPINSSFVADLSAT
jgi:hypothetical protein